MTPSTLVMGVPTFLTKREYIAALFYQALITSSGLSTFAQPEDMEAMEDASLRMTDSFIERLDRERANAAADQCLPPWGEVQPGDQDGHL